MTNISGLTNTGKIKAKDECAGGIIGYVYLNSSYILEKTYCHSGCDQWSHRCIHYGEMIVHTSALTNTGDVSGNNKVGEMFGSFSSDAMSFITTYTLTCKVTVDGEVVEGEYVVVSNSNLTLSGREITGAENTEAPE